MQSPILKDDLSEFEYCENCAVQFDGGDCQDVIDSNGLTKATFEKGCGFLSK